MTTAILGQQGTADPEPGQLVAGRYRLLEQIGHGRLGDIYEAEDIGRRELGISERVALQLLPDSVALNNSVFDKLELGYTVLQGAPHPGIVPFLNIGRDRHFGYVVMNLLQGASLRVVLRQNPTLPLEEVVPVLSALADALQFLHSKSIVHGRVVAENVFITGALDIKLLDVVPMPPSDSVLRGIAEQSPLHRNSFQDDTFDLACLVYEMLAGTHPFNHEPSVDVRESGLEPARVEALPDRQWEALRRALVPNEVSGILTVAEFQREFGVTGTERLPRTQETQTSEAAFDLQPPGEFLPDEPAQERPRRSGRLRPAFLAMVLAGLIGWYLYGQPGEQLVTLLEALPSDMVDAAIEPEALQAAVTPVEPGPIEPAPAKEPVDQVAEAAAPVTAPAESENTPEATDSDFAFASAVVTVSERDGAARIGLKTPPSATDDISWWTTAHTAEAGEDFVALQGKLPGSGADRGMATLIVPLVDDATREPLEDFFLHLGRPVQGQAQLVPIDTVRIDIVDDD